MANPLLALEHKVLRSLNHTNDRPERWLLAVSGGVDSVVLSEILWRWRRKLRVEITIAHVHHGHSRNNKQNLFRTEAQALIRELCQVKKIKFLTRTYSGPALESEAALRTFRLGCLREWFLTEKFDRVVFAHHADDLLETRLLRVLRGAGRQGLRAMAIKRGNVLRPLLQISRSEIEAYALGRALKWSEDPSNSSLETSLRNWLRREWLPQLEKRSPGAKTSVARSLSILAEEDFTETIGPFVGLRRTALDGLSVARREDVVARYLRSMGLRGYSRNHVQELLKRLGKEPKSLKFKMLGCTFEATPDFLWASRV